MVAKVPHLRDRGFAKPESPQHKYRAVASKSKRSQRWPEREQGGGLDTRRGRGTGKSLGLYWPSSKEAAVRVALTRARRCIRRAHRSRSQEDVGGCGKRL